MALHSLTAASMLLATAAQPTGVRPAEQYVIEFAQRFCVDEKDRLAEAERFVPAHWTQDEREERRDVTCGLDAQVPRHDLLSIPLARNRSRRAHVAMGKAQRLC